MEEFLIKIGIATLVAITMGIDREIKKKGIGLKTLITITVASCLLTVVSVESSYLYAETQLRVMDPGRIPSYIISGIGFLGAGVILRKHNDVISGLTTAAMVWASAGLGIAIGLGFPIEACIVALIVLVTVNFLPWVLKFLGPKKFKERKVKIRVIIAEDGKTTHILKEMKKRDMEINHVKVKDIIEGKEHQMDIIAFINEKRYITDVYEKIKEIEKVLRVEAEGL